MKNTQLLCTFTKKDFLATTLRNIEEAYDILNRSIFILQDANDENTLFCTFNTDYNADNRKLQNTILIHRKKETNTLYTINALNALIISLNNGVLDKTYKLNWENYTNSIILLKKTDFEIVKTELFHIKKI